MDEQKGEREGGREKRERERERERRDGKLRERRKNGITRTIEHTPTGITY